MQFPFWLPVPTSSHHTSPPFQLWMPQKTISVSRLDLTVYDMWVETVISKCAVHFSCIPSASLYICCTIGVCMYTYGVTMHMYCTYRYVSGMKNNQDRDTDSEQVGLRPTYRTHVIRTYLQHVCVNVGWWVDYTHPTFTAHICVQVCGRSSTVAGEYRQWEAELNGSISVATRVHQDKKRSG